MDIELISYLMKKFVENYQKTKMESEQKQKNSLAQKPAIGFKKMETMSTDTEVSDNSENEGARKRQMNKPRMYNSVELSRMYEHTSHLSKLEREALPLLRVYRSCRSATMPDRITPGSAGLDLTV